MARAFLIVMDSFGIGGAPDADQFFNGELPDTGANTLAHIARDCGDGLALPVLDRLGLGAALELASGARAPLLRASPEGAWGCATEQSPGKDTPSGHWELAGLPVPWDWHYFPKAVPTFPEALRQEVCALADCDDILGNCHASGTAIIAEHGARHIETGWPICYTSADSVFQIAAHENHFGLEKLLEICQNLTTTLHGMKVGRVIARPFVGAPETGFERTSNRRDFAITPPAPTLCDWVQAAGGAVHAVGKIGDIFSMRGIDDVVKGNDETLMQHLAERVRTAADGSLTFANFVEFDSLYGHRRDVEGYARHLRWFDGALGQILPDLRADDLLVVTADHGNDPSWPGTDHTRERVPVLVHGMCCKPLGEMVFSDVAHLVATHLGVSAL